MSCDPAVAFVVPSSARGRSLDLQSSIGYKEHEYSLDSLLHCNISPPQQFSVSAVSLSTNRSFSLKHWKHRLITKEDPNHVHKLTGMAFVLSSSGLMTYAVRDLVDHGWTQSIHVHGIPFLSLLTILFCSSVLQSFSSIRLACHHRRGQPAVRNTFLSNAAVCILCAGSAFWASPWYPTVLNGLFSKIFYFTLNTVGIFGMFDNMCRLPSLIGSRQTKSSDRYNVNSTSRTRYWMDMITYILPILIGGPFFLAIGWQFGLRHDRTFYLDILHLGRFPHLATGAVYAMVMSAAAASYSSFIVTLRDKKLINKRTEGLSLTVIMLCMVGSLSQAMKDPGVIPALLGLQ